MAQHPRSRWMSYCIIISAKTKGSVTLVSAAGKPPGRRLRRRRLSLPREKIRERLRLRTLLPSAENAGKSIGIVVAVP